MVVVSVYYVVFTFHQLLSVLPTRPIILFADVSKGVL